ncbi:MAG TPA: S-layer homology domain-containing protein, partial [Syntrophomonadaceae bacterium]|nr:S-layer homology domain-containing protein [Syntrophomonadaceae bacterium]
MTKKKDVCWLMLAFFMMTIAFCAVPALPVSAAPISDIQSHWAADAIQNLADQGIVSAMPDGTFRPDKNISRAEFAVMVVKAFKLTNNNGKVFSDSAKHWAKNYITIANAYGIINGYSDTKVGPDDPITREQMAVMIVKAANLQDSSTNLSFNDGTKVSAWAKDAVAIVSAKKVMSGLPDGSFLPQAKSTRAQAAVVINNALQAAAKPAVDLSRLDKAGTYGPSTGTETVKGNITILAKDVILQNTIIEGNLTIDKAVGEGNVTLKKVVVKGNTYINGGGMNSVYFIDTQTGKTYVMKDNGPVRIVASGTTEIAQLIAQSSMNVQEVDLTGKGFDGITVDKKVDGNITVNLVGAKVESLDVKSEGVTVNADKNTNINTFVADAKVVVTGTGTIENATINASGVTFETQPENKTVAPGISGNTGRNGGGSSTISI